MSTSPNIYVAVVDDEISICTSLSRLLRLANFQPICYPSAEAFLEDKKHPQFDCLVFDIRLKGMSGLELFRLLTEQRSCPPVIFVTAIDDPEIRARAATLGCAGFFCKSDPGAEIVKAVRCATSAPSIVSLNP